MIAVLKIPTDKHTITQGKIKITDVHWEIKLVGCLL